jgi:hypothetical protein
MVNHSVKTSPSATCVSADNVMRKDTGIFNNDKTTLNDFV